jgi:hypothetical protein
MSLAIGLLLALLSAIAIGTAFFAEHTAVGSMPKLSLRRPWSSLRLLFTSPRWLVGYLAGWIGWGIYIVALHLAPLSLVQTVAAGGVGVVALTIWRWDDRSLTRTERAGALLCVCGLAAVAGSLATAAPSSIRPDGRTATAWIVGCIVAAGAAAALSRTAFAPGAGLGAAAGLLYAAADIATKGALSGVGWILVPILFVCTALAFVTLQLAFQRGNVLQTAGLSTLLTNVVPVSAGIVLFREKVPFGPLGGLRLAGFSAVVAGAVLLARRMTSEPDRGHRPPSVQSDGVTRTPADTD